MGKEFEVDLTGVDTLDGVDAGGKVPVGWYRAKLEDYYEDTKHEGRHVFEVVVRGGAFDGQKLFYSFFDPANGDDEAKQKRAQQRIAALASRLNLLVPGKLNKVDFDRAAGQDIVVRVVENKRDAGTFTEVGYLDIYPPDHHGIPDAERKRLGLPPARAKDKPAAAPAEMVTAGSGVNGSPPKDPWAGL